MTKLSKSECVFICIAIGILITLMLYNVFSNPSLNPKDEPHEAVSSENGDNSTVYNILEEDESSDENIEESSDENKNGSKKPTNNNSTKNYDSSSKDKSNNGKININTASAQELEELPGIGEVLAERIVSYRSLNHGFGSIDEIMEVNGIGTGRYNQIKDLICVR